MYEQEAHCSTSYKDEPEDYSYFEEMCCESDVNSSFKDATVQCSLCDCDAEGLANREQHNGIEDDGINLFRIENLKDRSDIIKFYTGFDDYDHLMRVFNLFGDEVNNLRYYPSIGPSQRESELTPCNEFYLTLITLRKNLSCDELSFYFQISIASVNQCFITWINYLYCKLKETNLWIREETRNTSFIFYRRTSICMVIFCVDIRIEKPENLIIQQDTYSTLLSTHTLKLLIGVSSSGCVIFVSDAYGGSISNRQIFEQCGIINLLQRGDIIFIDGNFNIQDLVAHIGVIIDVISEPSQVQRSLGMNKNYEILNCTLGRKLVSFGGRIVFVCYMIENFRKKVIEKY